MPETTTQLTESEIESIAARKAHQYGTMVSLPIAERDALIRDWGALRARLSVVDDELKTAEAHNRVLTDQNAALRASVAAPHGQHALDRIQQALEAASEERYQSLREWEQLAERWQSEGDMYGWNFHKGMAAGANYVDIFYHRIAREVTALRKELAASSPVSPSPKVEEVAATVVVAEGDEHGAGPRSNREPHAYQEHPLYPNYCAFAVGDEDYCKREPDNKIHAVVQTAAIAFCSGRFAG